MTGTEKVQKIGNAWECQPPGINSSGNGYDCMAFVLLALGPFHITKHISQDASQKQNKTLKETPGKTTQQR